MTTQTPVLELLAQKNSKLKAMMTEQLAKPLPKTYDERFTMLSKYLASVTQYLESTEGKSLTSVTDQVEVGVSSIHEAFEELRKLGQPKTDSFREMSQCDQMAGAGVVVITAAAIAGGGAGAVAAFAICTYGLFHYC